MISGRLKTVILRQLKLNDFPIESETTADQIPGWDSLSHVAIISAVEAEFKIRFATLEIIRLRKVGDLQAAVDRKSAASHSAPR